MPVDCRTKTSKFGVNSYLNKCQEGFGTTRIPGPLNLRLFDDELLQGDPQAIGHVTVDHSTCCIAGGWSHVINSWWPTPPHW